MIFAAPASLAARIAARPCPPGPMTTTLSPMAAPPFVRTQRRPLPMLAQVIAAASAGTSSAMRCTRELGARYMYWLYAPHRWGGTLDGVVPP